jgi:hypothetical protein
MTLGMETTVEVSLNSECVTANPSPEKKGDLGLEVYAPMWDSVMEQKCRLTP